ncbi:hypothetical protein M9Y10_003286 [Tritrichomonas musculus]|uniref:Myb-like DNA-binding domain containing protein n=1 Tax=Tritrichomonas musculus TaxID=1915356 RepID=A0ABR2JP23_9EUKA
MKRSNKFSEKEDTLLCELVNKFGPNSWKEVSLHFPNKTLRQCRERWNNYLSSSNNDNSWTNEEDSLLINKHNILGSKWSKISQFFNQKTSTICKNRFLQLQQTSKQQPKTSNDSKKTILPIKNRSDLRNWFLNNHKTAKEFWIHVNRKTKPEQDVISYLDAVEEALCFGWIDSTVKTTGENFCIQRFSPRRPNSHWTELNKARCDRLEKLGLMTDSGRAEMKKSGKFQIDEKILNVLKSDQKLWNKYKELPDLYVRIRIQSIQQAKGNDKLFKSRLDKFIENTLNGKMYGNWNDGGRLN